MAFRSSEINNLEIKLRKFKKNLFLNFLIKDLTKSCKGYIFQPRKINICSFSIVLLFLFPFENLFMISWVTARISSFKWKGQDSFHNCQVNMQQDLIFMHRVKIWSIPRVFNETSTQLITVILNSSPKLLLSKLILLQATKDFQ